MTDRIFADFAPVTYGAADSDDLLAYRFYDPQRLVLQKTMADHLRVAVCYWHSFNWPGHDIFGAPTFSRPWSPSQVCTQEYAELKLQNAFDFFERLGAPFFCFHDVDAMATAATATQEHKRNLASIAEAMQKRMEATSGPDCSGGRPISSRIRATLRAQRPARIRRSSLGQHFRCARCWRRRTDLDGANYVLWGGREGYDTILNTDLRQELDQLGRFLNLVVEHKHKIGFKGTILIEPKPHEPAKHQYDRDTATVYGFLERYGLADEVRVNIEANHATLAGNSVRA